MRLKTFLLGQVPIFTPSLERIGVGRHSTEVAAPGSILGLTKIFILDVTEIYKQSRLVEIGPRLGNVDQTHLVLVTLATSTRKRLG